MKPMKMNDGSTWQMEYDEEKDEYIITITTDKSVSKFSLNYSEVDELVGEFLKEI